MKGDGFHVKRLAARLLEQAQRLLVETDAKGMLVSYGFSLKVVEKNNSTSSPNAHPWTLTSYRAVVHPRAARVRILNKAGLPEAGSSIVITPANQEPPTLRDSPAQPPQQWPQCASPPPGALCDGEPPHEERGGSPRARRRAFVGHTTKASRIPGAVTPGDLE